MAGIKRRMKRYHKKVDPDFYVVAWAENGNITVIICAGPLISGTGVLNTGVPDGDLGWLAEQIVARIEQGPCRDQEEALDIADQIIADQKPALLALVYPCNEIPFSKRQCKELGALH